MGERDEEGEMMRSRRDGGVIYCRPFRISILINISAARAVYRELKIYGKTVFVFVCWSVGPFLIKIWSPGGPGGI